MSKLPDDDAALFRDAIGPVKPLAATPVPPRKPPPKPRARMAERDEADARSEFVRGLDQLQAGDQLSYKRDALPSHTFNRLKRGQFSVQDELDLHGATALQAEGLLRQFFKEAHDHDIGCVRIIHGKGLQADGAPVLKNLIDRLLRQRNDVLAFHSALANQGGTGAVLVLLRRT
ncbi:MAG: Smr/MutS family protein [Pseudoxanthomonas sp.]